MSRIWIVLGLLAGGCSRDNPRFDPDDGSAETTFDGGTKPHDDDGTTFGPPGDTTSVSTSGSSDPTLGPGSDGSESGTTGSMGPPCLDDIGELCDAYDPISCPQGYKCSPLADLGDGPRCVPIQGGGTLGSACALRCEQTQDTCAPGHVCLPDTEGRDVCVGMCQQPDSCSDPFLTCVELLEPEFGLCLLPCDPLAESPCPPDGACILFDQDFACTGDQSGPTGGHGDPCTLQFDCDPGLMCIPAAELGDCMGVGCCTEMCDLFSGPGPGPNSCSNGLVCLPYLPSELVQPNVGVCAAVPG